jgi:hypothetical protein
LLGVNKERLLHVLISLHSAFCVAHKAEKYLMRKFKNKPLIFIKSVGQRGSVCFSRGRQKKFSVIRSPFVFKKTGESFIFTHLRASFRIKVAVYSTFSGVSNRSILKFLLRNTATLLSYKGVGCRIRRLDN